MQRWETNINVIHNSDGSSNQRGDATTSRANVDGIDYELIGNISDDNDIDSISSNDSSTMSNSLSTDCENLLDDDLSESTLADDRDNDAYSDHSNDSHTDNIDNDDDIEFNYQDRIISPFLYKNGSITLEQSILSILDLYLKHKWTKASLRDTLKMLQEMLPADNRMPETVHKLFRYVQNLAPPFSVIKHFYCRKCLCYNGINDKLAHCTCNASDNTSFFLEIDIREQIKFMFEHRNLADKLILPSSKHDENIIADITDGSEYLRVNSRVGRQECDLTLILNTDGLSVIKSSKSNCWPLVFVIAEVPEHLRESFLTTIGLWYDNKCKPLMNTFLKPFCAKLRQCFYEGIEWTHPQTGKKVVTRIVAPLIVADAPARAAIQNIHNFNGRYGCNICEIKMKRSTKIDGKKRYRIYRYTENFKLRTSSRMRAQARKAMDLKITQVKGVKGPSIIYDLPLIDPGACVLPEYMHSVLLGVVRQITQLWFNKKGPWNLEKYSCDIDKFLSSIRPPYFFNRLPRCITTLLQFYKASEFYNFILFYSLPALVDYLPEKYSQHWILLVKAIFILLQDRIKESNLDEADQLLKLFVSKIEDLYGDRQLTYNVHQLLHLVLVVKRWGPLWATSAFPFENFNGFLANCVHGTKHIGQEMIKNLTIAQGVQVLRNQVMENNTATSLREKKNQLIGSTGSGRKHPVLLYIHGESYDWGSGNPYDGSVLASYTDQVIVTINYRLGVLGFLNANTIRHSKARVANYGLMDQIAALQWVQENIALFGGDPGNVTLMGQGTGAACVNFLAISPTVMPGLFKRAILLSGSALSSWAVVEEPVMYAVKLARAANCTIPEDLLKDHELIVDCLRDASLEELMMTDTQPPTFLSAFGPSVDGVVIKPDFQKDLLSYLGPEFQGSGQLPKRSDHGAPITSNNKYDLLFGVTTSEALWRFAEKDVQQGFEGERRDRIIRTYVRNAYTYHLTEIFYTVVNEYTDWERTVQHPKNTRDACVQALSDAQFVAPLVQTGDLFTLRHMKKPNNPHIAPIPDSEREPMPKTYFYVFDYQMKGGYPEKMGSVHGEELPFVFGAPLVDGFGHFSRNYTRTEVALSENIIQYFANFVRTGNPNSAEHHRKNDSPLPISQEKSKFRSLTWDQYDPVHQKYLEIGVKPRIKNHYRAHQLSVWLRLVPELHRAGMEDVEPKHNLFRGHSDPTIYDGSVRPDPLMRVGDDLTRRSNVTTEAPTTTDYSITTCVSHIQSTNLQNIHNASTDTLASLDAAGYAAYSTALSVTIAIGCSLLILNVLIFAGVYYQRDKTRLEVKSLQQQQMMNQQCGPRGFTELKQPPPSHSHFASSGQVIVDVENEMLRRNVMKGGSNDPGMMQQGQSTHTLPHQHHYQHQKQHGQQHATLPRASVIPEMSMQGPPNGSIHLKVPRAPPPPRAKSPPENQPLLQGATVSSRVSQASMSEMRV